MKLTKEEKAARYDALQVAIKMKIEEYKRKADEHARYTKGDDLNPVEAFRYGQELALRGVVADMEAWI